MLTPGINKGRNKKKQVISFNLLPKPSVNNSHPHTLSQRTKHKPLETKAPSLYSLISLQASQLDSLGRPRVVVGADKRAPRTGNGVEE